MVDSQWHEISEKLVDLEELAEDATVDAPTRQLASAVASRVFFHLDEPSQALRLALEAGEEYFNLYEKSLYNEAMLQAAMEAYTKERANEKKQLAAGGDDDGEEEVLDGEKLRQVVEMMFQRCYRDGCYGHALGGTLVIFLNVWMDLCCDCFDFTHLYNVLYGYALNFILVYVSGHGST